MAIDPLPPVSTHPTRSASPFVRVLPIEPTRAWVFWDLGVEGAARLRLAFDGARREEHRVHASIGDFFVYHDVPFSRLDVEIVAETGGADAIRMSTSTPLPPAEHGDDAVRWGRRDDNRDSPSVLASAGPAAVPEAPFRPAPVVRAPGGSSEQLGGASNEARERFLGSSRRA